MIEGAARINGLSSLDTNLAAGLKQTEWQGIMGLNPVGFLWILGGGGNITMVRVERKKARGLGDFPKTALSSL